MHLIAISRLRGNAARYPDVGKQVEVWYATVKGANWNSLEDVRVIYRDAEVVGNFIVFTFKVNAYRLIVEINYENSIIYYKYLLMHAEYDQKKWKNDPYF